ncbi:LOW QUALITY PROTEIN: uncharacterized protein LOC144373394 [Ictidomys tridecemlineatus]
MEICQNGQKVKSGLGSVSYLTLGLPALCSELSQCSQASHPCTPDSCCAFLRSLQGTYQGQWAGGMRHGYSVRQNVPYGMATVICSPLRTLLASLRSEQSNGSVLHDAAAAADSPAGTRGGFVLNFHADAELGGKKKGGLFRRGSSLLGSMKLRKSESKSSISSKRSSVPSDAAMSRISSSDANSTISFGDVDCDFCSVEDHVDATTTETYMGEWKNDKRNGFGISERSDGMKYEGEWANNKRHGYGCTVFPDRSKEEGKYKNNILVRGIRKQLIPIRNTKTREKVDRAIEGAQRAAAMARTKVEIANSRYVNARSIIKYTLHTMLDPKDKEECGPDPITGLESDRGFLVRFLLKPVLFSPPPAHVLITFLSPLCLFEGSHMVVGHEPLACSALVGCEGFSLHSADSVCFHLTNRHKWDERRSSQPGVSQKPHDVVPPPQVDEETEAMNLVQEAMWGEDSVPPLPPSSTATAISRAFSQRLFLPCASSPLGAWEGSRQHQGQERESKQPPATHSPCTFPVASFGLKAAARPISERTEPLIHICEQEVLGRRRCPSRCFTVNISL